jgi:hypothetical protein
MCPELSSYRGDLSPWVRVTLAGGQGRVEGSTPGLNLEGLRNATFWVDQIAENPVYLHRPEQLTGRV